MLYNHGLESFLPLRVFESSCAKDRRGVEMHNGPLNECMATEAP